MFKTLEDKKKTIKGNEKRKMIRMCKTMAGRKEMAGKFKKEEKEEHFFWMENVQENNDGTNSVSRALMNQNSVQVPPAPMPRSDPRLHEPHQPLAQEQRGVAASTGSTKLASAYTPI